MKKVVLFVFLFAFASLAAAQDLVVAAASDLNFVFPEITKKFEQQTGKKVNVIFGSSGHFYQQTQNGAPFDVFFSADIQYPQKLESAGLVEPGSFYTYAIGHLVLFVPSESKLNLSKGMRVLLSPEVKKIAIANPQHAPYGRAAAEALKKEGLYDQLQSKFTMGENISQTAQFVASGNTDAGLIALSLASAPAMKSKGRYVEIPTSDYTPLEQAAVVLKTCKDKNTAQRFMNFVKSPEIVKLMSQYGFTQPGTPGKKKKK